MTHHNDDSPTFHIRVRGRVTGPYTVSQLATLRSRSKFGRANEVSRNGGATWQPASTIEELFENKRDSKSIATKPAKDVIQPDAQWHYVDSDGAEQGPITESRLIELAKLRVIGPATSVHHLGESDWVPAAQLPMLRRFLAGYYVYRLKERPLMMIGVCLSMVVVVLFLGLFLHDLIKPGLSNRPTDNQQPYGSTSSETMDTHVIHSMEDESMVASAIGRTVCSVRTTFPNQSVIEFPKSHGTAFAITSTGYFLTNRHVIEDLAERHQRDLKIGDDEVNVATEDVAYLFLGKLRFKATVVHASSRFDMAILKIKRAQPQRFFALSGQSDITRRTEVVALGFPGLASTAIGEESKMLDERFKTQIVNAMKSKSTVNVETLMPESAFSYSAEDGRISRVAEDTAKNTQLFHSAKIFPGNSGGPLVNRHAVVIGINTLFLRDVGAIGDQVVTGDRIYIALAIKQMKDEIKEHVPDPVVWVD